jgi:alkaline phosphatase
MKKVTVLSILLFASLHSWAQKVHAHNDYEHDFPFWEAYTAGARSIEADVFLKDGRLFVAHNKEDIDEAWTLVNLYFEPLTKVLQAENFTGLQLLIDFKTEASPTLKTLMKLLEAYPGLINNEKLIIAISGNRPESSNYSSFPAYIQFDHQDAENWPENMANIALLSLPFYKFSFWNGESPMPEKDKTVLKELISIAHQKGLPIRFWATPDTPLAWKTLKELGVDYINTDLPYECFNFLNP